MSGFITSLLRYEFMAWCLVKHRDNFTFTLHRSRGTETCKYILPPIFLISRLRIAQDEEQRRALVNAVMKF